MATTIPLQGGAIQLQGTTPQIQGGVNPQQAANPQQPTVASSVPVPNQYITPAPAPQPQPQTAQVTPLNSIFDPYIGSRPSPSNGSVLEYFNKQTGQGFSTPQELFNFASGLGAGQVNSFDQLHAQVNQPTQATTTSYPTNQPVQNSATPANPYQQLAQTAGNAGLSPQDLLQLAQANSALTPDQVAQIRQSLGIDQVANTAFGTPAQSTVDLFNQAYSQAGLGDLKSRVQDLSNQIAKAQQDYLDAQSNVNENPFLDEASRVGRIDRLNTEAQQRIGNLQQQQQNLNDLYTQGLSETNAFVTRYTNDFNTTRQQALAKLDFLNQQAQTIAQAEQAQNAQQVYRYLPDYLQAKQQASEPFGSAQYGYFKYDPNTKTYTQVSGPAAHFESNPITGDLFNNANGQPVGSTGGSLTDAFGAPAPAQTTLAQQNNNPGNIRTASGQFAVYTTPQAGWQALENDIQAKISGNNSHGLGPNSTLQDFFNVYAPTGDGNNNPSSYAQAVAKQLGVTPTTKLGSLTGRVQDLAVAIATHEGYFNGSNASGTPSGNIIDQSAQQLVDGTAAPSQFSKRGATYQLILDKANQLSQTQKGVPFDAQQAEVNFSNREAVRPILNNEASAEAHLDTVLAKSAAFNRSDSPIANKGIIVAGKEITGDPTVNDYLTAVQDAQAEIAKVLSGTGTPTDEARSEAANMLNPYLGPAALASQIQTIRGLMKQKIDAYTNNNNGAQQSLSVSSSPVNISDINFSF
jgi:hypothetical protein